MNPTARQASRRGTARPARGPGRLRSTVRDERGSAAIEVVMLAPVLTLLVLAIVFGGRVALARQAVQAAAADAARAASIARSSEAAETNAHTVGQASVANQQLTCTDLRVDVDTSGFRVPPGLPADVQVSVSCDLAIADLALPGLPGTITVNADVSSPLDTYRGRR